MCKTAAAVKTAPQNNFCNLHATFFGFFVLKYNYTFAGTDFFIFHLELV